MELSEVQREILQDVYNYFKFKNEWPSNREMELKFHEHGDWQELIESIGDNLIYTGIPFNIERGVILTIEGINQCRSKTKDLDNFINAIGIFYEKYVAESRNAVISKEKLIDELEISEEEAIRLCILISGSQSSLYSGGSGKTGEDYISTFNISNEILKYKNVTDIKGYLEVVKKEREKRNKLYLDLENAQKPSKIPSLKAFNVITERYEMHSEIKKVSSELFENGHFAQAVLEAFKKVISEVKEIMKSKDKDSLRGGDAMMGQAFSGKNPIIKINENKTLEEKDEQKGFMFLFKGIVAIRNRKAHENIELDDPNQAYEYLCLASILMRLLELSKEFDS